MRCAGLDEGYPAPAFFRVRALDWVSASVAAAAHRAQRELGHGDLTEVSATTQRYSARRCAALEGEPMSVDVIPLWVFFIGTITIILLSVETGFALGKQATRRSRDEKESPVAAIGGAVLGLVAFMLAFTFSIASGRFDLRKELVREDANAIRTAWL